MSVAASTPRESRSAVPLRVMHVIDRMGGYGAETSLREVVPALQSDTLVQAVTVLWPDGNDLGQMARQGIELFLPQRRPRGRVDHARHVHRAIQRFRPDLVHTTLFEADLAGRLAGLVSRTPVMTSLVNTSYVPWARPRTALAALKFRGAQIVDGILGRHATFAFHAITEAVADAAVAQLRIDHSRVFVVPRGRHRHRLGEPSTRRRVEARRALGVDEDVPLLLNVARQEPQKGQVYLLEAFHEILRVRPDALLLIAGREGRSTTELQATMERLRLDGAARFLGRREDIGDLLCAADVFVFPSLYEGLGGAVLEAMAMEIPIVACDVPALREVLAEESCGLLVPPADPRALAHGILKVFSEPWAARRRAEQARSRFEKTYSFGANVDGMRTLYGALGQEIVATAADARPSRWPAVRNRRPGGSEAARLRR